MIDIITKTDEIIEKMKQSDEIKEMIRLKKEINNDPAISELMDNLKVYGNNEDRIKLFNMPLLNGYIKIQNELDYCIMNFNSKISSLINTKACNYENN